eukprot:GHVT01096397.1.p1 GENE.GHVT01096397.1~~GHVT01096397.1.p1  ORF type:complete len:192 (-),score=13.82 GHVT01096397.1:595-1170(-)
MEFGYSKDRPLIIHDKDGTQYELSVSEASNEIDMFACDYERAVLYSKLCTLCKMLKNFVFYKNKIVTLTPRTQVVGRLGKLPIHSCYIEMTCDAPLGIKGVSVPEEMVKLDEESLTIFYNLLQNLITGEEKPLPLQQFGFSPTEEAAVPTKDDTAFGKYCDYFIRPSRDVSDGVDPTVNFDDDDDSLSHSM